ncbi:MAG: DUF58 domain-containing protein [Oscillospiraceae bacterium]|nr:DUF58 domain-containing protein [Oscillospiraceae bacterium]
MKRFRFCYYLSIILLLLAGLGTGRREYYFMLTVMLLVVGYAFLLNIWTIVSFSYIQELNMQSCVKGNSAMLKIGIYNDKPFPFTMMKVIVEMPPPAQRAELSFNLDPNSHIYYDIPIHCAYRGVYDIGMTVLEVNDVFGLLKIRFDLRHLPYYRQRSLVVYPRLLQLAHLPAAMRDAKYSGGGTQQVSEDGESFSDTRQYRFGDPFKRVHRILSARKRQLFVKRYDVPMETAAIIAVDTRDPGLEGELALRYADIACECAAAITHYCLRTGYVVDLVSSDEKDPVAAGRSPRDFSKIYDRLAIMPFNSKDGDICAAVHADMRRHPNLKAVYIITSRPAVQIAEELSMLINAGCAVKCLAPVCGGADDRCPANFVSMPAPGVTEAVITSADDIAGILGELS